MDSRLAYALGLFVAHWVLFALCLTLLAYRSSTRPPRQLWELWLLFALACTFLLSYTAIGCLISKYAIPNDNVWTDKLLKLVSFSLLFESLYVIRVPFNDTPKSPIARCLHPGRLWVPLLLIFSELLLLNLSFALGRPPQIVAIVLHGFWSAFWQWETSRILASGVQITGVVFLGFNLDVVYLTTFLLVTGCLFLYEQVLCGQKPSGATVLHSLTNIEEGWPEFRICLLGSQGVGKTRLIRMASGSLEQEYTPTIEDTVLLALTTRDKRQKLLVTDTGDWTGPREQFPIDLGITHFDAYIVVYDRAKMNTFKDVEEKVDTLTSLREPILLVSTVHKDKEPTVSRQHGFTLAHKYGWDFLEGDRTNEKGEEGREHMEQEGNDPFTKIAYQLQARTTLNHAKHSSPRLTLDHCLRVH